MNAEYEIVLFAVGFIAGVLFMTVAMKFIVSNNAKNDKGRTLASRVPKSVRDAAPLLVTVFAAGLLQLALGVTPTLAQTPVPLEIPTAIIFTETNNWMAVFAPIAAIGAGIGISIAVLNYVTKMIKSAF